MCCFSEGVEVGGGGAVMCFFSWATDRSSRLVFRSVGIENFAVFGQEDPEGTELGEPRYVWPMGMRVVLHPTKNRREEENSNSMHYFEFWIRELDYVQY